MAQLPTTKPTDKHDSNTSIKMKSSTGPLPKPIIVQKPKNDSERSQSKSGSISKPSLPKTHHSTSRAKSKPKHRIKQAVHSANVHEKSHTIDESKERDYFEHSFIDLNIAIPDKEPTDTTICKLQAKKEELKNNPKAVDAINNIIQSRWRQVSLTLVFDCIDESKMITKDDICFNLLNARYLKGWLNETRKFKISDIKTINGKILEFIADNQYKVYLYLVSKQQIKNMPEWSKNNDTVAGVLYYNYTVRKFFP